MYSFRVLPREDTIYQLLLNLHDSLQHFLWVGVKKSVHIMSTRGSDFLRWEQETAEENTIYFTFLPWVTWLESKLDYLLLFLQTHTHNRITYTVYWHQHTLTFHLCQGGFAPASVSLSVSRIMQKVPSQFSYNLSEGCCMKQERTIFLEDLFNITSHEWESWLSLL